MIRMPPAHPRAIAPSYARRRRRLRRITIASSVAHPRRHRCCLAPGGRRPLAEDLPSRRRRRLLSPSESEPTPPSRSNRSATLQSSVARRSVAPRSNGRCVSIEICVAGDASVRLPFRFVLILHGRGSSAWASRVRASPYSPAAERICYTGSSSQAALVAFVKMV